MLDFFSFFFKQKPIKNHSLTLTAATEGSDTKADLNPEVKTIAKKIKLKQEIDNEELNKLLSFYFNTENIPAGYFKFRKSFAEGMVFEIKKLSTEENENGDISKVSLTLFDIMFNNEIEVKVSVKDFHELFQPQKFFNPERETK